MLIPKNRKFKKQFKGVIKGKASNSKNQKIIFGNFALKALEKTRLNSKQIEAARKIIVKKMKRLGYLWIRIFPDTPISDKPSEIRMGRGKGSVDHWVSKIKPGQILYEVSGVSFENAKEILKSGSNKLPIKTKIISRL